MTRVQTLAAAVLAIAAPAAFATAPFQFQTVVALNDPTPSGNGTIGSFPAPQINNAGQVFFFGFINNSSLGDRSDFGYFRAGPAQPLVEFARKSDHLPGVTGLLDYFDDSRINDAGLFAGRAGLTGTALGADDSRAVYLGAGANVLTQIARENQPTPNGDGLFDDFADTYLDNLGRVTFVGYLRNTANPLFDSGLFRGTGGALTTLARAGDPAPNANGTISYIEQSINRVNAAGQLPFRAKLTATTGGDADDSAIFRTGSGPTVTIAREGQPVPGGNGLIGDLVSDQFWSNINDAGQVVFPTKLTNTSGGTADDQALIRGSGGALTLIARKGQPAPDGDGTFDTLYTSFVTDSGAVAFSGTLANTLKKYGMFLSDGGNITQIARTGQLSPDGNGTFNSFGLLAANPAGQMAFTASLDDTLHGTDDDDALYLYDPNVGLRTVVHQGDPYLGSTILFIDVNLGVYPQGLSLNDLGQLAFAYTLADGREGIAIASIPEPSLVAACGLALLLPRARRRAV